MLWVPDHGGDWINLGSCFSLTVEPVSQPDGALLYQLRASSGSDLYAVLAESREEAAVQQARDLLLAELKTLPERSARSAPVQRTSQTDAPAPSPFTQTPS